MSRVPSAPPSGPLLAAAIDAALAEDMGLLGDITTNATISADAIASAKIVTRKPGVISGLPVAEAAFRALDRGAVFEARLADGGAAAAGSVLALVKGKARALLTAERVALNFLGRMSGIATLTRRYVDAVSGTAVKITDTRKTAPGLRPFDKYAVRCGGGYNHRAGLFDAILIKDNHIAAAGGVAAAIGAARSHAGHMVKIEVEVDGLDQLDEALRYEIDAVLLDNMTLEQLREAVRRVAGRVVTEASGGVSLDTVRAIARTGVDFISAGALTHSAPVFDLSLDFESG